MMSGIQVKYKDYRSRGSTITVYITFSMELSAVNNKIMFKSHSNDLQSEIGVKYNKAIS